MRKKSPPFHAHSAPNCHHEATRVFGFLVDPHRALKADPKGDQEQETREGGGSSSPLILTTHTTLLDTITTTTTRKRTYTFVVTRVSDTESIIMSSTSVRDHVGPSTQTVTRTISLTLTIPPTTMLQTQVPSNEFTVSDHGKLYLGVTSGGSDEARHNLATRVMSNGVEVIVAGDKSTLPGDPSIFRILPSSIYKPYTLAPSTLQNNVQVMMAPSEPDLNDVSLSLIPNQFVTKTCLTTFTYLTTYMQGGKTKIESREKVISNIATEERNTINIIPTPTAGIVLSQTPNLAVGEFHTTYTYLNTILDGELPIVVTSKHTVTNTITAPDDYLSVLQPSEQATPVYDTNTYFSTVSLTKTLNEEDGSRTLSTTDVLTQVVITEFLPPGGSFGMTAPPDVQNSELISTTDVVKTYFVTYTYYNTILENGKTIVRSNVSMSSDVVTEKLYVYPKKTGTPINVTPSTAQKKTKAPGLHVFSTKTYLTTYTYFTTVLHKNEKHVSSTVVNSHTKVVENVKTETVPPTLIPEELYKKLKKSLKKDIQPVTTLATLLDRQTIEITAMTSIKPSKRTSLASEPTKQFELSHNVISESPSTEKLVEKVTLKPKVSKRPAHDHEGAPSNIVSQIVKNTTKVHKIKNDKNDKNDLLPDLLGSFNINRLSALSPVINAMAGLISNNLLKGKDEVKHVHTHEILPTPQPQKVSVPPAEDPQNRSPLYIPVNDNPKAESQKLEAAYNGLVAPAPPGTWIDEEEHRNRVNEILSKASLKAGIGGGIPISPGEIINTNADVIVGRPGVVGPRVPYNSRVNEVPIGMQPPPIQGSDSKLQGSDVQENYIGPPPPAPLQNPPIFDHQGVFPGNQVAFQGNGNPQGTFPGNNNPQGAFLGPKVKKQESKPLIIPPFIKQRPPQRPGIPLRPRPTIKIKIQHNYQNFDNLKIHQDNLKYINDNHGHVYEIQKAPAIFSTDLPPIHISNVQQDVVYSQTAFPEVVESNREDQLLVNIQPSQVASVVIPDGGNSALVYGGAVEPHKKGEYVNELPPHLGEHASASQNDVLEAESSDSSTEIPHPPEKEQLNVGEPYFEILKTGPSFQGPERPLQNEILNDGEVIIGQTLPPFRGQNSGPVAPVYNAGGGAFHMPHPPPPQSHAPNVFLQGKPSFPFTQQSMKPTLSFDIRRPGPPRGGGDLKVPDYYSNIKMMGDNLEVSVSPLPILVPNLENIRHSPHNDVITGNRPFFTNHPGPFEIKPTKTNLKHKNPAFTSIHAAPKPFQVHPDFLSPPQFLGPIFSNPAPIHVNETVEESNVDHHKEDDVENADGEVIQESNSHPLTHENTIGGTEKTPETSSERDKVALQDFDFTKIKPVEEPVQHDQNLIKQAIRDILNANVRQTTEGPTLFITRPTQRPPRPQPQIPPQYVKLPSHPLQPPKVEITFPKRPLLDAAMLPPRKRPQESILSSLFETTTATTTYNVDVIHKHRPEGFMSRPQSTQNVEITHQYPSKARPEGFSSYGTRHQTRPLSTNLEIQYQNPTKIQTTTKAQTTRTRPTKPIQLNLGEVMKTEDGEIFDSKESQNPHNHASIEVPMKEPPTHMQPPQPPRDYELEPTISTPQPFAPRPSDSMMPPPPQVVQNTVTLFQAPKPSAEKEIAGMKPPPKPKIPTPHVPPKEFTKTSQVPSTSPRTTTRPTFSLSAIKTTEAIKTTTEAVKAPETTTTTKEEEVDEHDEIGDETEERPSKTYVNIRRPTAPSTSTTTTKSTRRTTTRTSTTPKSTTSTTKKAHRRPPTKPKEETPKPSLTHSTIVRSRTKTPEPETFLPSQDLASTVSWDFDTPDVDSEPAYDDIIYGSESYEDFEVKSSMTIPLEPTEKKVPEKESGRSGDQSSTKGRITLPTKYITNTHTLTITSTKTTIVKSQGIPSTHTYTKLITSTRLDTITETHTLVAPTRITIHATPTIREVTTTLTTTTSLIEHHFPPYPMDPNVSTFENDEADLDEFIIDKDVIIKHSTPVVDAGASNSIFVVMTDQKKSGVLQIDPSMIETHHSPTSEIYEVDNEIPTRDEPSPQDVNHVLLGGILIASSPPKLDTNLHGGAGYMAKECKPECKATKNELCQRIEGLMKCVCRPGFARMFPDHPCKPTYTYAMKLALDRSGRENLQFDSSLGDPTSPNYAHMVSITHEGLDRMAMQSELRDVYHGVHVTGFEEIPQQAGLFSNFYLQLSDNIDERRLVDIFKQYLVHHNYSLGGTNLFASRPLNELEAADFNECQDPSFHDCSENALCFNLRGTYTCSCKEGYSDVSENPSYPGRLCSSEQLGCEKCHYHGTCYSRGDEQAICECFKWYTGASCHINLKVILIGLISLGLVLVALLLICCIMTCSRRDQSSSGTRNLATNINMIPHMPSSSHHSLNSRKIDKRAMIQDSSSETSEDSHSLPYVRKKIKAPPPRPAPMKEPPPPKKQPTLERRKISTMEQRDRSLTVMIPRAKYHPSMVGAIEVEQLGDKRSGSVCSATEAKLLNYLDASPSTSKIPHRPKTSPSSSATRQPPHRHSMSPGALVSAGFEVSATVGGGSSSSNRTTLVNKVKSSQAHDDASLIKKSHSHDDLLDPMSDWLEHVPQNDLRTVSEARSYDETTIQPPTKSLRSIYDKNSTHTHYDEANTMAERDVGSTFLLPHTHLYKQGSECSGFDSL